MSPVRAAEGDVLFMIPELRKVTAGIVLSDDGGLLEETIPFWRDFDIPLPLVQPFYDRVAVLDLRALGASSRRLTLDYGVENMVLGWLHSEHRSSEIWLHRQRCRFFTRSW
jgi:hypothetical protein